MEDLFTPFNLLPCISLLLQVRGTKILLANIKIRKREKDSLINKK
jgi:hypothetical protein